MAELMLGQPLFPGESGIDQLVEIIKVLGTPTRDQIRTMNPNYMEHKFPQIKPHPFNKVGQDSELFQGAELTIDKVFRKADPNAIDLISRLLEYTPTERLSAINAMVHPFFDELRDPNTKLPDSRHQGGAPKDLPALFDFSHHGKPETIIHRRGHTLMLSRIINCAAFEQAAGSAIYAPNPRCARIRLRKPQLQTSNERRNDGPAGLDGSGPEACVTNHVLNCKRLHTITPWLHYLLFP